MNQTIKDLITNLSIEELRILKEDLTASNYTLKLINEIILKHEQSNKICASCGCPIDPFSKDKMVLNFGSVDFEHRAHFCAYDCMRYFLEKLEKVKGISKPKRESK